MKFNQIKIQDYWFGKALLPDVIATYGDIPRGSKAYEAIADYLRTIRRKFLDGAGYIFVDDVDKAVQDLCKKHGVKGV